MTVQTWDFTSTYVGAQQIDVTSTVQQHKLGTRASAFSPTYGDGEFVYLAGVASTIVGSLVTFDEKAGTTTLAVAATRGPCAVAMSANVASQYGWYQVFGSAVVSVAAADAANALQYSTAVAGQIDDAVVAGSKIDGLVSKTAIGTPTAATAVCQLSYPALNGNG